MNHTFDCNIKLYPDTPQSCTCGLISKVQNAHASMFRLTSEQLGRKTLQEIQEKHPNMAPEELVITTLQRIHGFTVSPEFIAAVREIIRQATDTAMKTGKNKGAEEEKSRELTRQEQVEIAAKLLASEALPKVEEAYRTLAEVEEMLKPLRNSNIFGRVKVPNDFDDEFDVEDLALTSTSIFDDLKELTERLRLFVSGPEE